MPYAHSGCVTAHRAAQLAECLVSLCCVCVSLKRAVISCLPACLPAVISCLSTHTALVSSPSLTVLRLPILSMGSVHTLFTTVRPYAIGRLRSRFDRPPASALSPSRPVFPGACVHAVASLTQYIRKQSRLGARRHVSAFLEILEQSSLVRQREFGHAAS